MNKRTFIYLLFLLVAPAIYFLYRKKIEDLWGNFENLITITSYWTAILLFLYNSDLKFHFFVTRILNVFKYDHTTWIISCRYRFSDYSEMLSINTITHYFKQQQRNIKIKSESWDSLELLFDNKFLLHFRIQQFDNDEYELHLYTSKIIVPTKQNKKQIAEISEILESIEGLLQLKISDEKLYEIDIEYSQKSPYYSYWIRKLPEEMISNFNCSINLPNKTERITINKNHLHIRANKYTKLFDLTSGYVSLKSIS